MEIRKTTVAILCLFAPVLASAQFALVNTAHFTNFPGSTFFCTATSSNRLHVGALSGGVHVFDISDPAHPLHIGHATNSIPSAASVQGIAAEEDHVYLANAADGLRIYSVSDPFNPANVGHTNNSTALRAYASDVALSGDHAFVANGSDGLRIYDVTDPAHPPNVGHVEQGYAASVAIAGNRAYVGTSGRVILYDISSPASPMQLGQTTNQYWVRDVAVDGDHVYVAQSDRGFQVHDVSEPLNPVQIGQGNEGGSAAGLALAGNYLFVANWNDGLRMYDVGDPSAPKPVAHVDNGGFANHVSVAGNYAYLANSGDGLRVYAIVPLLQVHSTATNSVVISWPAPPENNLILQQSTDVTGPDWADVTNAVLLADNRNEITVPAGPGSVFFRLRFP